MELNIEKLEEKIAEIKREHKLSNDEIAEVMGINYSYLFKILNKTATPGKKIFDAVNNLCKAYNLNPNDYIFLN